jgi:hypothetical protein
MKAPRFAFFLLWVFAPGCGSSEREPAVDDSPPQIVSTNPASNAVNVSFQAVVGIRFDEPINRGTLSPELFHLELNQTPQYGIVSYNLETHEASLAMMGLLERGSTYAAVLEPGLRDLVGNQMTEAYRWSFTVQP